MRHGKTTATLLGIAVLALAWSAPAVAAPPPTGAQAPAAGSHRQQTRDEPQQYCNIVLEKLRPGRQFSTVISKDCDTDPAALAKRAPRTDTLLAQLYQHRDYGGAGAYLWGQDGPCDSLGYIFSTAWENAFNGGLSSYRVHNDCWQTRIHDAGGGNARGFCWDVPYVGDEINDDLQGIHLKRPNPGVC